jgi:fibronectin type 3 domain-containing protein
MKNKIVKVVLALFVAVLALPLVAVAAVGTVTNVIAKPGDAQIELSWTAVTGATNYKVYHGTAPVSDNEAYNLPTIKTKNAASQVVIGDLTNGQTYYFSVTAVDAAGNESEFYSEPEVSATPQKSTTGGNGGAELDLLTVRAQDSETVVVSFGSKIVMPTSAEQKFRIIYEFNQKPLKVVAVKFAPGTEDTLVIKTEPQEPGGDYLLVLPNELKSVSGASLAKADLTVNFLGSSLLASNDDSSIVTTVNAVDQFKVAEVRQLKPTELAVKFSRPVVLPTKAQGGPAPFTILNNNNPDLKIVVQNYTLDEEDPSLVLLTTDALQPSAHTLVVANVTDTTGELITGQNSIIEFGGSSLLDKLAPEDVTKLAATIKDLQKLLVALNWVKSANTANDLAEYVLYQSVDGQNFTKIRTYTDSQLETATVDNLMANTTYTFKLTAVDRAGNESAGVTTKVTLPETGPGLVGLALGSLAAGRYFARRKRNE